ncbi:preprotein translocase subunit YajC [Nesterenkonia ebinurensis]|uniref:preprotein translocase subunit YajC n=1 Tax=Nesterenkonia ebinurensis TaxID=2608252 RepID=UPI00123DA083|nr:preprotein translocase subunit YajC [Nesterenkonia ebinurensis]
MIDSLTLHLHTLTRAPLAGGEGGEAAGDGSAIFLILMFGILLLFVVTTWRRSKKMRADARQAHSNAVVGAEVVAGGGIVGRVVSRDEEKQRVTLEFSDGHRADFLLQAVHQVIEPAPGSQEPGNDPTAADGNEPK